MKQGLLLVDIQNDYFSGGAMVLSGMEQASGHSSNLLKHFREQGKPVFHVRHLSVRPGSSFFLPDTWGAEINESVAPVQNEPVIQKHTPNSFRDTELQSSLDHEGIEQLVVCGAMSHMCIDATTRAAFDLGYQCVVIEDACATRDLVHRGETIPAELVHGAFMAALSSPYAAMPTVRISAGTRSMTEKLIKDALMLWATVDPFGTLAVFAALTRYMTPKQRFKTAAKALAYAAVILVGAIVIGQVILTGMGVKLVSLQIAGGIILFLFGVKMIFDEKFADTRDDSEPGHDIAVFPLAVPSIASPGAIMAVIILTDNNIYSVEEQAGTTLILIAILVITFGMLLAAGHIVRVIGNNGAAILVKVMGMILAALSVELIFEALNLFEILGLSVV